MKLAEKVIKLRNNKSMKYGCTYEYPDGIHKMTYTWKPKQLVEVPVEVYEYLKEETSTFIKGWLVVDVSEEDESIKEEINELTDDLKIYTHDEMKGLIEGNLNKLKKEITKDTDRQVVEEFVRVAKELKIDSSSKKKYLAELLGHEVVEYVFHEE